MYTVLLRNPIFCDFSGGGGPDPLPPSGSAHVLLCIWEYFTCYDVVVLVILALLDDLLNDILFVVRKRLLCTVSLLNIAVSVF